MAEAGTTSEPAASTISCIEHMRCDGRSLDNKVQGGQMVAWVHMAILISEKISLPLEPGGTILADFSSHLGGSSCARQIS